MFSQTTSVRDSIIKYLIHVSEIDTICSGKISYYYDGIYIVPIKECKTNVIGIYRFGANTDHGNEFVCIINGTQITILKGSIEEDIKPILDFFDENKGCFKNDDIVHCLKEIIEIYESNNSQKVYMRW